MIEVQKLTKSYGRGDSLFVALKNVSLTIRKGESVAIVGKSGSGKSTLLHVLTGLDTPTKGAILFEGKNLARLDMDTWRGEHVGIVFQQFFLQSNMTVLQNVILPLKVQGHARKMREKIAKEAIERVGLLDKLHVKAADLSGGQKQRVAIARALVAQPAMLVADEPTGNLDSENGALIVDLLSELNQSLEATLIIVTHDEDLAMRCGRIIRLKDGELVEDTAKARQKRKRTL